MKITEVLGPYYAKGEVVWVKENTVSSEKEFEIGIKFIKLTHKIDSGF